MEGDEGVGRIANDVNVTAAFGNVGGGFVRFEEARLVRLRRVQVLGGGEKKKKGGVRGREMEREEEGGRERERGSWKMRQQQK